MIAPVETLAILEYLGNIVPWLTTTSGEDRSLTLAGTGVAAGILVRTDRSELPWSSLAGKSKHVANVVEVGGPGLHRHRAVDCGLRLRILHESRFRAIRHQRDLLRGICWRRGVFADWVSCGH